MFRQACEIKMYLLSFESNPGRGNSSSQQDVLHEGLLEGVGDWGDVGVVSGTETCCIFVRAQGGVKLEAGFSVVHELVIR